MKASVIIQNNVACAAVDNEKEIIIKDYQSTLDFMATVEYETGCKHIALAKEAFHDDFFILSSGLAGEVLQKFVNYKFKLAIIGDFSHYTSEPLKDFMYESNKGKDLFFVSTQEEAIERLSKV